MEQQITEPELPLPYHEVLKTFEVYIDHNPDRWRGGYVWIVSQNDQELSSGLSFSTGASVEEAWDAVLLMVG